MCVLFEWFLYVYDWVLDGFVVLFFGRFVWVCFLIVVDVRFLGVFVVVLVVQKMCLVFCEFLFVLVLYLCPMDRSVHFEVFSLVWMLQDELQTKSIKSANPKLHQ